jgi:5'-3' exonuclease
MLLIDGDIICYRSLCSKQAESIEDVCSMADWSINNIIAKADPTVKNYKVFLTGSNNFRKEIAVTAPYKGQRPEKPEGLEAIRAYLLDWHPSVLADGEEADDAMSIAATQGGASYILCTIDKDFDQVPGWHYNFVKDKRYCVSEREGLFFFYTQILTGDRIDNIIGVQGIGPVKAEKALRDCKDESAMFQVCVEMLGSWDRAVENGQLLWLRRHDGQIWEPPTPNATKTQSSEEAQ